MALHCNGNIEEMREVAGQTPELSGTALARAKPHLRRARHRSRSTGWPHAPNWTH